MFGEHSIPEWQPFSEGRKLKLCEKYLQAILGNWNPKIIILPGH